MQSLCVYGRKETALRAAVYYKLNTFSVHVQAGKVLMFQKNELWCKMQ